MKKFLNRTLFAASLLLSPLAWAAECGNTNDRSPSEPPRDCEGANYFASFTGNVHRAIPDLSVDGGVGSHTLAFIRYGNSRYGSNSNLLGRAHNWKHSYDYKLVSAGANQLDLLFPDGAVVRFSKGSSNIWFPPVSVGDRLTSSGNNYTLQRPDGSQFRFEKLVDGTTSYFQLQDFRDPYQQLYQLSYDSEKRLERVTEPAGRFLELTYGTVPLNSADLSILYTIASAPPSGTWVEVAVTSAEPYRYLRYVGSSTSYSPIAEVEFYAEGEILPLVGTPFGTTGASSTRTFNKAFDGDTSSYFENKHVSGGFVGIDLGAGNEKKIVKIRYRAPSGKESRMTNGAFSGSNVRPSTAPVITQVTASNGRTVHYEYEAFQDPIFPVQYNCLARVRYGDGTMAEYTYAQPHSGSRPVLSSAVDPRYSDAASNIRYMYSGAGVAPVGHVKEELNGLNGATLVSLIADTTRVVKYANGSTRRIHQPSSSNGNTVYRQDGLGRRTDFTYANNGTGYLLSERDPLGRVTTYTRTSRGNLLSLTHPDGTQKIWTRGALDLVLTEQDELGRITTYTRDASHRVVRIDHPNQSFQTYSYNSFGQILVERARNGGETVHAYNDRGLRTQSTDPLGNLTAYTYNAHDRLETVTDSHGLVTSYQYDDRGAITRITHPDNSFLAQTYDTFGNKLTQTNELGHTWSFTYDEFKRRLTSTDPLNRNTTWSYGVGADGCGSCHTSAQPTRITLPSGKITTITYDVEWQRISQTGGVGSPEAAATRYGYDAVGNLISTTDPLLQVSTFTFDNRNRMSIATDPLGNATSRTYDAVGNLLTVTDALNRVTTNTYDSRDRLLTTQNANLEVISYTYDHGDNLLTLTDAKSQTYSFEYDLLNRRTHFIYPGGSQETWSYHDTAAPGTVWTVYTARDGSTMSCTFDNRSRETTCGYSATDTPDITYTYDVAGRRLAASTSVTGHVYTYDNANQLLSETTTHTGLGIPFTVAYAYDADGNRSSLTYPDNTVVDYTYTARNQLKEVIANGPPPLATYAYNLNGQRTSKTLENGTVAEYTYDSANRLTRLADSNSSGIMTQFDYTLNAVGNRTGMTRSGALAAVDTYQFDQTDQITQANYANGARTENFSYDPVGNRITASDSAVGTTNYTTNALNQYTAIGAFVPTYDTRGNLTAESPSRTYTYDSKNRLITATNGPNTAAFAHDYRNRQMSRTLNGNTTYFVFDNWNLIAEYTATGAIDQKYIHGATIDEIVAKVDSIGTVYYHQDGIGSVTALTNSTGSLSESYRYDVFGNSSVFDASGNPISVSANNNRFLFTGREWITELELYDYRNRVYSKSLGRFLQTDPIRLDADDVNIYRYVANRPVRATDPLGLKLYECSSPAFGLNGAVGNHVYFYDTEKGRCERTESSGSQPGNNTSNGSAPRPGDTCKLVSDQSKADELWECCQKTANEGVWVPFGNDCHNSLDRCYKEAGTKGPTTPRLGKCCPDKK